MTEYPETPRTVPASPVVGMVGAGQLARMTSQAATGLAAGFRVLAATAPIAIAINVSAASQPGSTPT